MILPAPMLLSETKLPVLGRPGYIFEVKWDGFRIIAGVAQGKAHLRSRGGADYSKAFPEVVAGLIQLGEGPHILDGEVVVLDDQGRADFDTLQDRARRRRFREGDPPVVFMVFDALAINGRALITEPVEHRKEALKTLLENAPSALQYVRHFDAEHGPSLYKQSVQLEMEGLVAKRLGSVYKPGERSQAWVKVKRPGAIPAERFKR